MRIIEQDRSVIPACDDNLGRMLHVTAQVEKIGAYKIGSSSLSIGLKDTVFIIRGYTDKPVIYDHQKAGTDIHEVIPDRFMDVMVEAKINAVILFPLSGPVSQYEWTKAALDRELGVIVGGKMTHPRFLESDISNSKKKNYDKIFMELGFEDPLPGYIRRNAPVDIYKLAVKMGVTDYVVPGNQPAEVRAYRELIERWGVVEPVFYAPGFVAQDGDITEGAKAAGERVHAIVGRGIYEAEDMRKAVAELTSKL